MEVPEAVKVGVATTGASVYILVATALVVVPGFRLPLTTFWAMALTVVLADRVNGPLYCRVRPPRSPGVVPSVV